jgi:signal transduction histidine kinase
MTLQYARTTTSRRKQESKSHDQIPELLTQAKDLVADAPIRANLKEAMLTSLERVETATRAEREEHIGQIQMLRVLSATGAAVSIFNHQISAIGLSLSAIRSQLMELRHFVNANGRALHNELLQTTERAERLFAGQQSQLRALLGQRGRRRAVRINLYDAVAQVFDALRFYCEENQILLKNDVPDRLTSPPMYQSELYAVLLHLITNAVKAVSGTQERRISVRAMTDRGHLLLYILDTGVGLDPAKREEVFDYFVSYSTPHEILGPGTGLGLAVVRDIIREYNGTIQFIDALAPWRTCVEIRLPIRAGS